MYYRSIMLILLVLQKCDYIHTTVDLAWYLPQICFNPCWIFPPTYCIDIAPNLRILMLFDTDGDVVTKVFATCVGWIRHRGLNH